MHLWERQDGESDEAFEAFRNYRDMPKPRQMKRTAHKATAVVSQWFNDFRWKERALAYDDHLDSVCQEERELLVRQSAKELAEKHMDLLENAYELAQREFQRMVDLSRSMDGGPSIIKPSDLIKLAELVIKMQRLVKGEATERSETSHDLSKLSVDELREMEKLIAKAGMSPHLRLVK